MLCTLFIYLFINKDQAKNSCHFLNSIKASLVQNLFDPRSAQVQCAMENEGAWERENAVNVILVVFYARIPQLHAP